MNNQASLREIEQFLHAKIPITQAMGVGVAFYDGAELALTAPLAANHNHLGTAFGGSLAALATLAGYSLIWLELGDRDAHVVIRDSTMHFRKPVRNSIRVVCLRPDADAVASFKEEFRSKGKARIGLRATVEENGEEALVFEGTYVALR